MRTLGTSLTKNVLAGDYKSISINIGGRSGVNPADYGVSPVNPAADNLGAFNLATAAAVAAGVPIVFRAVGSVKLSLNMSNVVMPANVDMYAEGEIELLQAVSSGSFFRFTSGQKIHGKFTFDGGNTAETIDDGLLLNHNGLHIEHDVPTTDTFGLDIDGVSCKNFGDIGILARYLSDFKIRNAKINRCGAAGIGTYSPSGGKIDGNKVTGIFPGLEPGGGAEVYERNAYGVFAAHYGVERPPEDVDIIENTIKEVPGWEGIDCHGGKSIRVLRNNIYNCGQGIAFENHIAGVTMSNVTITGNTIVGESINTVTRSGVVFPRGSGININSSTNQTKGFIISENQVDRHGEARTGVTDGSGAIRIRHTRSGRIEGNVITSAIQRGIFMEGITAGTDENYIVKVTDNVVDGVLAHEGVRKGIFASTATFGAASGNVVSGTATPATDSYEQPAAPIYVFSFGDTAAMNSVARSDNGYN